MVDALAVKPAVLLADCSAVPDADVTALDQTEALHDALADRGIELWLSGPQGPLLELLRRSPKAVAIGAEGRLFETLDEAIAAFERRGTR